MIIPPPAICKVLKAWQSSLGLTRYIYKKAIYSFGEFSQGAPTGDYKLDAEALLLEHFSSSRACEVRHIAFSFPAGISREEALERLPKMCSDWITQYAPDRDWVAGIHEDNGLFHAHLAVQNVKNGKALRLMPHQVIAMSQMKFTKEARDAKGIGTPGLKFYTKQKKPSIADTIRTASTEQLYEWIAEGKLQPGRVNRGVVLSVKWDSKNGKKPISIRLDTLKRLSARAAAQAARTGGVTEGHPGRDTGLARVGKRRTQRRSHGRGLRRDQRNSLGSGQQQDSPLNTGRRPSGPGLQRDPMLRVGMAAQDRPRPAPRVRGPVTNAIRGLGRVLRSGLTALDHLGNFSVQPIRTKTKGK